ncbi:MAG: helicase, superfamily [Clostridia bacterium]|jgi:superfamily II DNA/RNA helicase|nr:helicase, superfamily [Clostridia bacterium]
MKNNFKDLGVSPFILKAIEEMGFETPTEVQSKAIPHILNQEDIIVMSKTGSGKTAVFGIPILQLTDSNAVGPQALILTPTRELAVQVDSDLKKMSKHLHHKTTAVYGQHNMNVEIQALSKGVSIVSGTPGRVYDHISHGNLQTKHIRFLVLDEADIMLDMGFLDQVVRIIKTLPKDRVTLLFSATIPNEIHRICRDYMKQPLTVEIESQTKTVDTTQQVYYRVNHNEKNTQVNRLLMAIQPESCMIFCNTRMMVDKVQSFLTRKGYGCQALHGDIPQSRRLKTIQQFKQGEFHLLVATDVAARGIHIDSLSLVINYDVPLDKDSYVHRIGRTGRAGQAGRAITLVTGEDIMSLYAIEEHIGSMIAEEELPSDAFLNENKPQIDKWIQANSIKVKPQQNAPKTIPKENQPKGSYKNPPQQQNRPKAPSTMSKPAYQAVKNTNAASPAAQTKPAQASIKPKPLSSQHTETVAAQGNSNTQLNKDQASTAKKPFLQQVLKRIFGK